MSDNGIRCPVKQLQLDRVYRICREFIILNKAGIHKAGVEPESMSAEMWREESEISREVREMWRELGSERVDVLSRTTSEKAQKGSTQSSASAEGWGLLSLFLNPRILWLLYLWLGWLGLWL